MVHPRFDWKLLGIAVLVWLISSGIATAAVTAVLAHYHKYQHLINKLFEAVV